MNKKKHHKLNKIIYIIYLKLKQKLLKINSQQRQISNQKNLNNSRINKYYLKLKK